MLRLPFFGLLFCLDVVAVSTAPAIEWSGRTMGTTFTVKAHVDAPFDEGLILEQIRLRLAEIDQRMSTYREDSEISQFNQAPANTWFEVSAETAEVVAAALDIAELTSGDFDPTVGPAVELWNFGSRRTTAFRLPEEERLQEVRQRVGYQKLRVRVSPPALRKSVNGLEVDLSAIAKGHGVDVLSEIIEACGVNNYMVEIGGEVRARGVRADGRTWRIGIESPTSAERRVERIIALENQAMASSGDYRNFFQHDGVTYSHTIDPHTAKPVRHQLAAVTVIDDSARRADALATAIQVMGPEAGRSWCQEHQVTALLLTRHRAEITTWESSRFPTSLDAPANQRGRSTALARFTRVVIVSAALIGLAILAVSLGVLLNRRPIRRSCGGLAGLRDLEGRTLSEACTNPSSDCVGEPPNNRAK